MYELEVWKQIMISEINKYLYLSLYIYTVSYNNSDNNIPHINVQIYFMPV
jgi:hypothetical protein